MASSILSSLLSKPQFSVVNANSGAAVIAGVKVKRVSLRYMSTIPRHMREDGTCIVDTRIIRSSVLSVEVICPSLDDVDQVLRLMGDRENLYTITSKGIVFSNMMAQGTSVNQNSDMLSAAPFRIYFKALLLQNVDPVICLNAGDSDNINGGIQILKSVTQTASGLLGSVVNSVSGLFGG